MPSEIHSARILIVEDDAGVARLQQRALERTGFAVATATSPEAARKMLRAGGIELMVLDYKLSGDHTGLDFYEQLKREGCDVPVILVTAFSDEALVVRALRAGVRDFVSKSIEYLTLLPEAVKQVLDKLQLEKRLAESEARFALSFRVSPIAIAISSRLDARYLDVNDAFLQLYGYSRDEVIGRTAVELGLWPDADRHDEFMQTLAFRGSVRDQETIFRTRTGELRSALLSAELIDVQRWPCLLVFIHDITERLQAQAALRKSEASLSRSQAIAHLGSWEWDLKTNELYWSEETFRILGLDPRSDVPSHELFLGQVHPDDRPQVVAAVNDSVRRGVPYRLSHRLLLRDGTEKTISEQGEVIIDAAGDPQRFVGTVLDISDRQRAERALRSAEALFRGLVEQSLVGIHIIQDGKYPYVNPKFAEIFGYTVEEVLALESWLELAVEEEREKIAEQVRRRLSGVSDNAHYLSRGRRKDGTIIDIELHGAQTEFDGRPAVIGTLLDITERKRAEETLRRIQEQTRQSQKMEAIGRLAGGVAHDFNNLLTIIVGNTELAREGLEENAPRLDALNDVLDACDRAAALTRQLLAFSRRQVLEPVVLDLNQLITDIDRLLRRLIGEDIQLVTVLGAASARVKADPAQLEQILLNLTVNARDAMPSGGRLTIETYHVELDADYAELHSDVRPGPYVLLAVSDTGAGMDEATRARLFEPFFTTKSPGRGTGMGLSMTYGIVKQSGGHISVYSELGRGTTFKIYFPRIEASISIAKPEAQVGATVGGNETILLVEDEHAVRGLAKRILETHGYLVLEAHHGRDAIRISDEYPGPIHLLVTDVIMPEMSGRQVADRLAESRPEIRVLFVSGYTDNAIMHHGVLEASTAFLQKPFTRDSLARKVRQVLDKQ